MNEEHNKYLINKYPRLYKGKGKLYCDGHIGGRDGWFKIVNELSESLTELEKTIRLRYPRFYIRAAQVKEKFGTLRYYIDFGGLGKKYDVGTHRWIYDAVYGTISRYENESDHACEVCGKFGKQSEYLHWIQTLCYSHYMPQLREQVEAAVQYGNPIQSYTLFKAYLNKRLDRSYKAKGLAKLKLAWGQIKWFLKLIKSDWHTCKYSSSYFNMFKNWLMAPYCGVFAKMGYWFRRKRNRWV